MPKPKLKETAESLEFLISQPLSIPTLEKTPSLIEAARSFNASDPATSDLKAILEALALFPSVKEAMLAELDLISAELLP